MKLIVDSDTTATDGLLVYRLYNDLGIVVGGPFTNQFRVGVSSYEVKLFLQQRVFLADLLAIDPKVGISSKNG